MQLFEQQISDEGAKFFIWILPSFKSILINAENR